MNSEKSLSDYSDTELRALRDQIGRNGPVTGARLKRKKEIERILTMRQSELPSISL